MAVKIRLRRMGAKKNPFYRIVVADSRYPRDGRFIEEIGTYDPLKTPADVKIDADKAKQWIANGAQPPIPLRISSRRAASSTDNAQRKTWLSAVCGEFCFSMKGTSK